MIIVLHWCSVYLLKCILFRLKWEGRCIFISNYSGLSINTCFYVHNLNFSLFAEPLRTSEKVMINSTFKFSLLLHFSPWPICVVLSQLQIIIWLPTVCHQRILIYHTMRKGDESLDMVIVVGNTDLTIGGRTPTRWADQVQNSSFHKLYAVLRDSLDR